MKPILFNAAYKNKNFPAFKSISGDGYYTKLVSSIFEERYNIKNLLLTTSCTSALEMTAILMNIVSGDEVIAPSFTFVSTVNAYVLRGAKIKFVDIEKDTMNIDVNLIEAAITEKTRAIIAVHYAGIPCNMDKIMELAKKYNLYVVEDAAQAVFSKYKGRYLGTIGHFGTYSFHETKNFSMGEGGALIVNDDKYWERANIIREKGTNRSNFLLGLVDKYTWVDIGSSFLPSDILAAYLYPQVKSPNKILNSRKKAWDYYNCFFSRMSNYIDIPYIPDYAKQNYHMFYIKLRDLDSRTKLINFLKSNNIQAIFHYIPLHTSPAGLEYGNFIGNDIYTSAESEKILRLPLYHNIKRHQYKKVCSTIKNFFELNVL